MSGLDLSSMVCNMTCAIVNSSLLVVLVLVFSFKIGSMA